MAEIERIVLIGFSGTGKSTVARLLADRLGWRALDIDEGIEVEFGATIPEIFATRGEAAFRAAERKKLLSALDQTSVAIATGGGAVVEASAWDDHVLGRSKTLVIALEASPEVMVERLQRQQHSAGTAAERPLLATNDPLARVTELKDRRQDAYDRASITLVVDNLTAEQVVDEVISLVESDGTPAPTLSLDALSGRSAIYIRPGLAARAGELMRQHWPRARRAWIVTDESVGRHHLSGIHQTLIASGLKAEDSIVPPREGSKSLEMVGRLYDWMLDDGIERGDVVVALGGGVIGDLAGFVAATCLRGVGLAQVPTSLVAMVDSSVGGKTGVNHRAGKNLIGAFYQPRLVVIDPQLLRTLPPRELTSGWGEVLKHGVIQASTPGGERADLLTFYERNAARLTTLSEPALTYAIRRNVALKAAVVEADEREAGLRAYLNFGHTLGHAIEAAGYHCLHGEAIAVGMRAATRIGVAVGLADEALVRRIDAVIERFGLPMRATVDEKRVLSLIGSDKKRVAGQQRWVLPCSTGGVVIRDDVPDEAVRDALRAVTVH